VDVPFEVVTEGEKQSYILIDTAGLRKARRVDDSVEFFSTKRTEEAISRCDIAILVLDAVEGITEQDKKVADKIVQDRKACIVIVNKWDMVEDEVRKQREKEIERRENKNRNRDERREKNMSTLGEFGAWVQERLFFLDYAPVIFTSAKTGFHLDRLLEAVRYVEAELRKKIPTALLNRSINDAVEQKQPVSAMGHRVKFFYATQVRQSPPTFLLFVNRDELFSDQYKKYLADHMRSSFGFEGCPIILVPKARPKTIESFSKGSSGGRGGAKENSRENPKRVNPYSEAERRRPGGRTKSKPGTWTGAKDGTGAGTAGKFSSKPRVRKKPSGKPHQRKRAGK
jgi:GTP-binding protein